MVAAKVRGKKLDKKLKKWSRARQRPPGTTRKRGEQEALPDEYEEQDKENEALKEKASSLAKEIRYRKYLLEEVRKARGKERPPVRVFGPLCKERKEYGVL
ncbi:Cyclic AMP-dependent transcription factor ATF-4 [Myotis davidii]|uniref:Cyclic AMP-dependent transcription factor ATF-4 n=1 Tax=Myotis davidii TaxID=225400 RepID=L5M6T2_MYODS|nr:Cyclic AMP-dependent transcription factor ATF-4 [Myotis davidii]